MKYYFNIINNYLLGYFKYGCKKFPILFPISIPLYIMDLYMLFNNHIDTLLLIGLISYTMYFSMVFIGYINKY